ncbi:hypothetical protein MMC07_002349 [Pseudocyphellaria aurata]|nr:hypothetical protein [Pseudocyphellaria aurata]
MKSSRSNAVTGESLEKTPNETSSRAIPHQTPYDGIDDAETNDRKYSDHGFSRNDRNDMHRMGKVQELKGTHCRWTISLGLRVCSTAAPAILKLFDRYGLTISSAYARNQYCTGWMSALSWQAGQASGPFLVGTIIQALLTVNDTSYEPKGWQGTLFVFAVVLLIFALNVWGANAMPYINNILFFVHIFGFLAMIITLWVRSPHNTAGLVFTQFSNEGGWNSIGLSLMVGQISAIYGLICSDGAAHISEEIQNAGLTVARTMVWSYVLNGTLGLVLLITFLFCITSVDDALNDPSEYPFLYVFRNAVSQPGLNALSVLLLILVFAGTVSFNISTSRQTWAFARDRGLPFSAWIAHVHPRLHLPVNAIALSCIITSVLALINIGSNVAFNAIISLNLVSLMLTYFTSIGCVLVRRVRHPALLPPSRWSLGHWGIPINVGGMAYALFAFFWCFWPNATPVDAASFNWAVVLFLTVAIVSLGYYEIKGKKVFKGPVVLVQE